MRGFARYTGLVIKHYFNGFLAWVLNFVTLGSLFISIKFPVFPVWIGLLFFLINTFLATFLVWLKEVKSVNRLKKRLEEIESTKPKYKTSVGDVKKHTVQNLIEAASEEIEGLQQKIENIKNSKPISTSGNFGGLFSGIKELQQLQSSVLPAMRSLGYESDEDKLERLKAYHSKLLKHAKKLDNLYQLSLSIESSRHDKNVEIEIISTDTDAMIVQDDYQSYDLPSKERRQYPLLMPTDLRPISVAGKYYLDSSAEDNKAISELAYINAQRPTSVFDSAFYIYSKKEAAKLVIKVRSTKLTEPQVIEEVVQLAGVPIRQAKDGVDEAD